MKAIFFFLPVLTACAPIGEYLGQRPEEVTVEDALADIGRGLNGFKEANSTSAYNYGLLVDEVTLTLNVKASRSGSDKLVVDSSDVSPPALGVGQLSTSSTLERGGENTRSNVIVVKLKNRYTASLNSAGAVEAGIEPVTTLATPTVVVIDRQPGR